MSSPTPPFRVSLWDTTGTGRGRGSKTALIDNAKDIGVSAFANEGGEFFMTLPANHEQLSAAVPWQTHYEVSRLNSSGTYDPIGVGLIDNYVQHENETIIYGIDYLSLYDLSISGSKTSYTSTIISSIISTELNKAMNGTSENPNSPTEFITLGTIQATSKTTTALTSFEPRLTFVRNIMAILSAGTSTLPHVQVTRSSPITISFTSNDGATKEGIRLEWGGNVNNFSFDPGLDQLATKVYAIGQKREGASILYSTQTYASPTTYGLIQIPRLFIDMVDQQALDDRTLDVARKVANQSRVALGISSGKVIPYSGWDLMDSVRVIINRGLANVNALYTVWGFEWIGHRDGHEDLFLDLQPKQT